MKYLSADRIYTCNGPFLTGQALAVQDDGTIMDIVPLTELESADVLHYSGIICPGFINTHCHLELSHMKGKLETGTGLLSFIGNVVKKRGATEEEIQDAIYAANTEMYEGGIVAVGDISNQTDTAKCKEESLIRYYTFVEMFDFMQPQMTAGTIEQYEGVHNAFKRSAENKSSLTPHAPYSVSPELLNYIDSNISTDCVASVHNQETPPENELFLKGSGAFYDFYKSFDLNLDNFKHNEKTAIHYILEQFAKNRKMLFVHNTLTNKHDIQSAKSTCKEAYWASCPNANLYIENALPDYKVFIEQGAQMTLGTDSLTSNWQLSILEEMKSIKKYQSFVSFDQLLDWACINGARALGFDETFGSIEKGKNPGLVHIDVHLEDKQKGEPDIYHATSRRISL